MPNKPSSLSRLWRILTILRRHSLVELVDQLELKPGARLVLRLALGRPRKTREPLAQRIRLAFEDLGPVFIKFGQALSTRPDLLPKDIAQELAKLQDQVPPFPSDQAMEMIRACYGEQTDHIFASIDPEPLASASVAQVHAATLQPGLALEGKNGVCSSDVVIKILRPNVENHVNDDLALMRKLASLLEKSWPRAAQFKPLKIVAEYENTIRGELDLRREAANGSQMGANFEASDLIYVPRMYWDYIQQSILVMERIYGTSVRDVEQLKALGYNLEQLAADGVNTFFKQAFEDNFFHADMHPGNIFVSDQGKWIALDFGIMGVLDEQDKQYLAEMLLGFFNRDYRAIAEVHLRSGWIPADTQMAEFEAAVRMVCEPNFAKPISEISFGTVLMELFQTVQRFEMPVQPQLVLLYKTLLQIEGLGRQLYPQLNLWDTAKPFLENWMKQQLSPQTLYNEIKRDWPRWRAFLKDLPDHLDRLHAQQLNRVEYRTQQEQTLLKKRFHQNLGFGTAATSVLAGAGSIAGWLPLFSSQPWLFLIFAAGGLVWAYRNT